jgi:hypothetical protein
MLLPRVTRGPIVIREHAIIRRVSTHRRTVRSSRGDDARKGADAVKQLANEWVPTSFGQIETRKIDIRDEHTVLLESQRAGHQIFEAAGEEQGSGEQHNREGNLGRNEHPLQAKTLASRTGGAPRSFQDRAGRHASGAQRGQQAKNNDR